jgi:hypothetical protein
MKLTRVRQVVAVIGNLAAGAIAVGVIVFAMPTTIRGAIDEWTAFGKRTPIRSGELCDRCQRPIIDVTLAAEGLGDDADGGVRKFRTLACMLKYLNRSNEELDVVVTDKLSGRFVRPQFARFVRTVVDSRTGEGTYVAFQQPWSASSFAAKAGGTPMDWESVQASERVRSLAP